MLEWVRGLPTRRPRSRRRRGHHRRDHPGPAVDGLRGASPGLPPVVGLYASVVPVLVYAVFGGAIHLALGLGRVDVTGDHVLRTVTERLHDRGVRLLLVNVHDDVSDVLDASGFSDLARRRLLLRERRGRGRGPRGEGRDLPRGRDAVGVDGVRSSQGPGPPERVRQRVPAVLVQGESRRRGRPAAVGDRLFLPPRSTRPSAMSRRNDR